MLFSPFFFRWVFLCPPQKLVRFLRVGTNVSVCQNKACFRCRIRARSFGHSEQYLDVQKRYFSFHTLVAPSASNYVQLAPARALFSAVFFAVVAPSAPIV